jgi:GNAT superfamily N-acetyltransferase
MLPQPVAALSSARQFADAFQIISGTLPDAEVRNLGGLRPAYAGTPLPFFNYFFFDKACAIEEFREQLSNIRAITEDREAAWLLVVPEEGITPYHRDALEAREIAPLFEVTGMQAATVPAAERELPQDLEFSSKWTRQEIGDFTAVNMLANDMPLDLGEASVTSYFLLDPCCFPVVAYREGQAVSACLAILLSDCIYLAWIATAPEHQNRGCAEATMREAIRRAAASSGHEAISLHATEPERALLQRLGLSPVARFAAFGHGL